MRGGAGLNSQPGSSASGYGITTTYGKRRPAYYTPTRPSGMISGGRKARTSDKCTRGEPPEETRPVESSRRREDLIVRRPAPTHIEEERGQHDERRAPHRRLGPINLLQHMIPGVTPAAVRRANGKCKKKRGGRPSQSARPLMPKSTRGRTFGSGDALGCGAEGGGDYRGGAGFAQVSYVPGAGRPIVPPTHRLSPGARNKSKPRQNFVTRPPFNAPVRRVWGNESDTRSM